MSRGVECAALQEVRRYETNCFSVLVGDCIDVVLAGIVSATP